RTSATSRRGRARRRRRRTCPPPGCGAARPRTEARYRPPEARDSARETVRASSPPRSSSTSPFAPPRTRRARRRPDQRPDVAALLAQLGLELDGHPASSKAELDGDRARLGPRDPRLLKGDEATHVG